MTKDAKNLIVGLDIGTSKVVAVVAEVMSDGLSTKSSDSVSTSRGAQEGRRRQYRSDRRVDPARARRSRADGRLQDPQRLRLSIAGSHIRSFNSSGMVAIKDKEVTATDVARVIETAKAVNIPTDQQLLHTVPQEFIVDSQEDVREPIGMSGIRLEVRVHIVTGAVSAVQNIVKCVRRCGLEVSDLILQPMASADAVLTADEKNWAWS
ncbi:cell division protein FtsA [Massilia sp. H-1]|nr:cell division protein FtsA [Massilia sp. H-1]